MCDNKKVDIWEDQISLNSDKEFNGDTLYPIQEYPFTGNDMNGFNDFIKNNDKLIKQFIKLDKSPLPKIEDREGYYGIMHHNYWLSGLRDIQQIDNWMDANSKTYTSVLDLGCSSGRLLRHFHTYKNEEVYGCDINKLHVDWVLKYLPKEIVVFQNTSIPHINLPDNSLDLITAFSVFSHIESFDTTWIMEIKRVLKPNGVAWLTVNDDNIWHELSNDYPIYQSLIKRDPYFKINNRFIDDKIILRYDDNKSYTSHVFYKEKYIQSTWGRILKYVEHFPSLPSYQNIYVLTKE